MTPAAPAAVPARQRRSRRRWANRSRSRRAPLCRLLHVVVEPGARELPVAVHRARGDAEGCRGLIDGEPAIEPTFDDARGTLRDRGQLLETFLEIEHLDRKSTRLNSSHLVISYA